MSKKDDVVFDENLNPVPIKKQIRDDSMYGSLTLYPVAISVPAVLGGFLFDAYALYFFAVAIASSSFGILRAIASYFFMYDKNRKRLLRAKRKVLEFKLESRMKNLRVDLLYRGEHHAASQIDALKKAYERLKEVVEKNIDSSKAEYEQCLGGAEVMFSQALDTLELILENYKNMDIVDVDYSRKLIELLSRTEGNEEQIAFQKQQLTIVDDALRNNAELIKSVEGVYTHLIEVVRDVSTGSGESIRFKLEKATHGFVNNARINKRIREKIQLTMRAIG